MGYVELVYKLQKNGLRGRGSQSWEAEPANFIM
jgi:hypothetical protein